MKSLRTFRAVIGWVLVLGVVLFLLATGPAGAVSADEQSLFNVANDDRWHDTVQALLAKGVSPNVPISLFDKRAAMHAAAEGGAVKNLAAMLRAGGNPSLLDGEGNTPLHWACAGGGSVAVVSNPEAIRLLVRVGADLHRPNGDGMTPLHVAVGKVSGLETDVIKTLLDLGARPEAVDGAGLTALQRFARDGIDEGRIVTLLLDAGANPDRKTPGGDAPLHLAVKHGGSSGKADVVEALLDGGAEPCVQDAKGYTPYHMSYEMTRIHQALDGAQGHDLACDKKKQAEETQQAEGGTGAGSGTGEESPGQALAMQPFGPNWIVVENQPCQWFPEYLMEDIEDMTTVTWSGGCVDGKLSGQGRLVLQFPDGGQTVYEGSMRAGKEHGQGTAVMPGGVSYEGGWRAGKPHGDGMLIDSDGQGFEGKFQDGNLVCLKNINC